MPSAAHDRAYDAPMATAVALDLDGVLWLDAEPIPGAADAVTRLRAAGHRVGFVTNNSYATVEMVESKLASMGVAPDGGVLTSAQAAATLVTPGARAVVCGGPGIVEALLARGVEVVPEGPADVVLVGFDWAFDYDRLRIAVTAVRNGAELIGTNDDPTYPGPDGPLPGGGALLAAVATASERVPRIAGKPHEPMATLVRARLGDDGIMVGDRPSTDGGFATTLGWPFGLVLSGVTTPADLPVEPTPAIVAPDLAALAQELLADA